MFGRVDDHVLVASNRLARWLQEQVGLTMPMILRHVATATIAATVLAIMATAIMRGTTYTLIVLVFGAITISAFWRLLKRYSSDAEKDWSSDLARDYMVRAIGATEGQRGMREIGLIFAILALAMLAVIARFRPFDLVDMTMLALVISTMAHMYLSCAEPRPPGSGRRQFTLAPQMTGR